MFEINGDHIAMLNDTDLRTLVAMLCEAELRRSGLPISSVTAGGDQNAPDGGLDIRVDLPEESEHGDFVPRANTGYQVKVPNMPRAEIIKEMRPDGRLREMISELANDSGAYVIVSAKGSTADSALKNRIAAMRGAISDDENADLLTLDFYDRNRIASWVRSYSGLVAWVRERIGQPINEWHPYSNWAAADETVNAEYIVDDKYRLVDEQKPRDGELTIEVGMQRIRDVLASPQGTIRLVGLSGIGKTRFAQAMFDDRIGEQPLDSAIVAYADLGNSPDPSPRDLIRHLIGNDQRAIVIVDNCPPETHKALAEVCAAPQSKISLMTIEYDVGDDAPENTDVFRLYPSSEDVIEKLLEAHAPNVSQVDRRHIAELSDGNARVALALAHTVRRGESVTNLSDRVVFNRLFNQGHQSTDSLLRSAEAVSLVYSFNGEAISGGEAELPFLASLVGQDVNELFRNVNDLKGRQLVQSRGKWRALLPQALANKVAHQSLEHLHPDQVASVFSSFASERLKRSFSRRLGYLHESECAQRVVEIWFGEGGLLSEPARLNGLGMKMFQNIAPVKPDLALAAIERSVCESNGEAFLATENSSRHEWVGLLRSLAYDRETFERAALLIAKFVVAEPSGYNVNSARSEFTELFQMFLSGTHATIQQRLDAIDLLIQSGHRSQQLGLEALNRMLDAMHFSSSHIFTFGGRPRDYGWEPTRLDEQQAWFSAGIDCALGIIIEGEAHAEDVRSILATNLRGLIRAGMIDQIEQAAFALSERTGWLDGWKAIRNTIYFDAKDMPEGLSGRLRELEKLLKPRTLEEKVRAYVLCERWGELDTADGEPVDDEEDACAPHRRVEKLAEGFGVEVVADDEVFGLLLPELVRRPLGLGGHFGRGLALGASDPKKIWCMLVDSLSDINEQDRETVVLIGFLSAINERNTLLAGEMLDNSVTDPVLGSVFPWLQSFADIDALGVIRLLASIDSGLVSSDKFRQLTCGGIVSTTPAQSLNQLLRGIASMDEGNDVAIDILGMRIHSEKANSSEFNPELVRCGQELLCSIPFSERNTSRNHQIAEIIKVCFIGVEATEAARVLCNNTLAALGDFTASPHDYKEMLSELFKVQPEVALDVFVGEQESDNHAIEHFQLNERFPIHEAPDESIIAWGNVNPDVRLPRLASMLSPYEYQNGNKVMQWSSVAISVIDLASDKETIIDNLASNIFPRSWVGSLAAIYQGSRSLPQALFEHDNLVVVAKARELDARLCEMARIESEREKERNHQIDESFE
jgi:hypothetical protein